MRKVLGGYLTELVAETSGPRAHESCSDALAEARDLLEDAAAGAAEVAGWSAEEPLRLWKSRVRDLLHCPKRSTITDDPLAVSTNLDDLVVGLIVDAAAKLIALGAQRPVTAEGAVAFLSSQGDERPRRHLAAIGESPADELLAEATSRLERFSGLWPELAAGWWPRVEEPARVPLAGGSVVLGGRLDILLGGPPTDRPGVVIEVKGGRWHDSMRDDASFYGLLVGLRDDAAPAAVVSLAASNSKTHIGSVRPALLQHTAEKVTVALDVAARIAAGEPPEARSGSHCLTCPLQAACPAALEAA